MSDVCNGWPGAIPYAGTQVAHASIGAVSTLLPLSVRLMFLSGWIGKEVFGDIGGCGLSGWVALDSVADIACAVLGFTVASVMCRNWQTTKR